MDAKMMKSDGAATAGQGAEDVKKGDQSKVAQDDYHGADLFEDDEEIERMISNYGSIVVDVITNEADYVGDQPKDGGEDVMDEFVYDDDIEEMMLRYEGPDGAGWSKPTENADDQITVKMGDQPELSQDRGDASQMLVRMIRIG